jgi:uncharacterized SAM-binding protein YcdF (DUF218 family)
VSRLRRPAARWRAAGLLALIAIGLIAAAVQVGRWLAYPPNPRPADVIVVLGGRAPARIEMGVSLYLQEYAPELWHTGDLPPSGARLSEAGRAARLAIQRGVPPSAITLLATSSTWHDAEMILATARERDARRLLIVTDWTHSRRAMCTLSHHMLGSGIELSYAPPPPVGYGPDSWWRSLDGLWAMRRELPAVAYYWLYYGVNPFRC